MQLQSKAFGENRTYDPANLVWGSANWDEGRCRERVMSSSIYLNGGNEDEYIGYIKNDIDILHSITSKGKR